MSGAVVACSGLIWLIPGLNVLSAIAAIAGLILITARFGYSRALVSSSVGIIAAIFFGSLTMEQDFAILNAAAYLIMAIIPGIAMGVAARGFYSPARTIYYGMAPALLPILLCGLFYGEIQRSVPVILNQVKSDVVQTLDSYPILNKMVSQTYGADGEAREHFFEQVDKIVALSIKIAPGLFFAGFLTNVVLGLFIAGHFGSKVGLMLPRFRPFHTWRASDWWFLPTAAGLALIVFSRGDFWQFAGANILIVTANIYAATGFAVIVAFFRRFSVPLIFRLIFYIIIFLSMLAGLLALAILGLVDSRFNFRRETVEKEENR